MPGNIGEFHAMKLFIPEYAVRDLVQAVAICTGLGGGCAVGTVGYDNWMRKNKSKNASVLTAFAAGIACGTSGAVAGIFAPEIVVVGTITYCGYQMFKEVTGPNHGDLK